MPGRVTRSRTSAAGSRTESKPKPLRSIKKEDTSSEVEKPLANSSRKRKRDVKAEDDIAEAHGQPNGRTPNGKKKRDTKSAKDGKVKTEKQVGSPKKESGVKKEVTAKNKSKYTVKSDSTPFPGFNDPTPEMCQNVKDILAKAHGDVVAPKTIPEPSLTSAGCGQVPSVLDALVRTRLSAATSNVNSSRAFKGLVEKFGLIKEGIGKGSVNWNRVRLAPQKDIFEAIKSGGLAGVKSKDIKEILNMVYEENQQTRAELEKEGKHKKAGQTGRKEEIQMAKEEVLSLDHLHQMSNDDAFEKLVQYPGVGPKTASCVLLFCMQRASFAVDTHVFRMSKWLNWVPTEEKAASLAEAEARDAEKKGIKHKMRSWTVTREKTYEHLDAKIPEELKYPLHVLFIKHGRTCDWCRAKGSKTVKSGVCPLAHLMPGKGRKDVDYEEMSDADFKDEETADE